jgi:hypothetical protein
MNNFPAAELPDLIVNNCPLGCDKKCGEVWCNKVTGHRIICICKCGHIKTLVSVWGTETNAESLSPERTEEDDT